MKKTPKKFYVKKPTKVKKNKSGEARSRFSAKRDLAPRDARLEFPNIFRIIPGRVNKILSHIDRFTLISFVIGVLVVLVGIALFDFQLDKKRLRISTQKQEEQLKEHVYWQKVVKEHEGYRDGYYMLALSEYRLNNMDQARVNIEKVLELDPFFEQGRLLKQRLQDK